MNRLIFLFLMLSLCCSSCKTSSDGNVTLPVLNVCGEYPVKKVNIHEIADVEYIPLETTQHSILPRASAFFQISDKYIITYGIQSGEILFFNRSGKYIRTINRKGGGGEEYRFIYLLSVDFAAEECFVSDGTGKLQVYSFEGEYRRSLQISTEAFEAFTALFDYDKEFLIGYRGSFAFDASLGENKKNFCLINKKSAQIVPIDLTTKKHISPTIHEEAEVVEGGVMTHRTHLPLIPLMKNGAEFLITDYASDTLYSFTEGVLAPIALRTPAVYKSPNHVVLSPWLFTDSYLYFKLISIDYDPANPMKGYDEESAMVWDRRTGRLEKWEVYDDNFDSKYAIKTPFSAGQAFTFPNYGIRWYSVETLKEQELAGELRGELKDIASKLQEEDNEVLMICKYK